MGTDLDGRIVLWNEGARRLYGYVPAEALGAGQDILHTPEDVEAGRPGQMSAAALAGGKWEGVVRRVRKDGRRFTARVVLTPRYDASGKPTGFLFISKDISTDERLNTDLRESQSYTRSLIESSIDALIATDPLGVISDLNEQMAALTGHSREELIGSPFKDYFTEPERAAEVIKLALREGKVTNFELTARARDGRESVVSYNASTFNDDEGKLQGVFAAGRDVTERKRLEEQLREEQRYLRGLIESSVDGLITVDPDGFITDVNDRMCHMSGYSRAEMIGTPFGDYYFTDPERARRAIADTLEAGVVTEYGLTLVSPTRRYLDVSFNASVFKDADGGVRGISASARDITDRVRLEEQLREQQTYLRGLIESSIDGLVTVDPDGFITDPNEQFCRMAGRQREELVGSRFPRYFTEPEKADIGVKRTLAEGLITNYDLVLMAKSGRKATVSVNASVFRGEDGHVQGIFASARDVSEQARLQSRLEEQQTYNRSLIESSADALFVIAPDGVVTDVNEEATRITGYSRKHLVGSTFAGYFTDPHHARAGEEQSVALGRVLGYELVLVTRLARRITVSVNAGVFSDSPGQPLGVLAAARDITAQKELEQQLIESQSYTRSMIESSIDALIATDPLGVISDLNEQMAALTGHSREELIGSPFKDYFTEPERAAEVIKLALREGKVTNFELTARARDGRESVVSYNASTFNDDEGKLQGVFAAGRDVTERKRFEDELAVVRDKALEASRMKSEFLANMSHEIRTPMNGVIGMTGLLLGTNLDEEQRAHAETVRTSGESLLTVINDILDFSKIEAGKLELDEAEFDLRDAVEDVSDMLAESAHAKGVELATLIEPNVPARVRGDQGRLRQILTNLLANGVKFTREGQVVVRVSCHEQTLEDALIHFEVTDTGIGIEPSKIDGLFDSFAQADTSTTRKYGGTGLGLAISRQLTKLMGGEIGASSELGQGSSFWFTARVGVVPAADPGHDPHEDLSGLRALIVDDVAINRTLLEQQFASWGIESHSVESGPQAIDILERAKRRGDLYDFAVLDYNMPGMDGLDLARSIAADPELSSVRLLMLTSSGDERAAARTAGVADCLTKPVRHSRLGSALLSSMAGEDQVDTRAGNGAAGPGTAMERGPVGAGQAEDGLRPTVLVAEDNPVNQRVAVLNLQKRGYHAHVAPNGQVAVDFVRHNTCAAVLMDCQMPELDGYEATAEIRRLPGPEARTPIIAMTAHSMKGDREACLAAGMDDYLSKPIRPEALDTVLARWVPLGAAAGGRQPEEVLDARVLEELHAQMGDLLPELVEMFTRDTPQRLEAIAAEVGRHDAAALQREAHALKGSSLNLGAIRLSSLCQELEAMARAGDLEDAAAVAAELGRAFDGARAALAQEVLTCGS